MLVLRLKPIGKKKQISFRIVVSEKCSKLNGRFVEDTGFYNPKTNKFSFKTERVKYWLNQGVQPSDTVYNLLVRAGIIESPKRAIKIKKAKKEEKEKKEEKTEAAAEKITEEKKPEEPKVEDNQL